MDICLASPIKVRHFKDYIDDNCNEWENIGMGGTQPSQLGVRLLEKGYNVTIVTLDKSVKSEVILEGERLRIRIGPYRSRIRQRMKDVYYRERKFIERSIVYESPEVVHVHWTYEYALGSIKTGVPTLITIRDWAPAILFNTPPWPYRFLKLLISLYVFWKGNLFTANSPYISEKANRWLGLDMPIVPNALRDDLFFDGVRNPDLMSPEFISVNNGFGPRKNVRTLLKAFKRLRRNCPSARLRLLGSTYGEEEKAHLWARSRDLTGNVSFSGEVPHDEVLSAVRDADVLVHPATEESFGNTLVEAMSQKTPVIAGKDSGAVPWVLNQGKAGILTDITSPDILATSMRKLVGSEDLWREYSEKGYDRAWNTFRLSKTVDKFEDMYEEILSNR